MPGRSCYLLFKLLFATISFAWGSQTLGDEAGDLDAFHLVFREAHRATLAGESEWVLRHHFLSNRLETAQLRSSSWSESQRSFTWVALGNTGLCPDNLRPDDDGLWTLALFNGALRNRREMDRSPLPPFAGFAIGEQRRNVHWASLLSPTEMINLKFTKAGCSAWRFVRTERPRMLANLLQHLHLAAQTIVADRFVSLSPLHAKILQLEIATAADPANSTSSLLLQQRVEKWTTEDWLNLTTFDRLLVWRSVAGKFSQPRQIELLTAFLDEAIASGTGSDATIWIGELNRPDVPRSLIFADARGRRLLLLGEANGFRERGPIALHRGLESLRANAIADTIRTLSLAVLYAHQSTQGEATRSLALRYLTWILRQYRADPKLTAIVQEVLPSRDATQVLLPLAWSAAFHADKSSWNNIIDRLTGRGRSVHDLEHLHYLATGRANQFLGALQTRIKESPALTARFIDNMLSQLEHEPFEVIQRFTPVLRTIHELLLNQVTDVNQGNKRPRPVDRRLSRVVERCANLLVGLVEDSTPLAGGSTILNPDREVFLGAIHIPPDTQLPWPFPQAQANAPDPLTPFFIMPDGNGTTDDFRWTIRLR